MKISGCKYSLGITVLLVFLPLYKKHKIVNKKMKWEMYISNSLKIMALYLQTFLTGKPKALWMRLPLNFYFFLGIFVNHFKLHNNNMMQLKMFDFIPALLWDIYSQGLFSQSIQSIKTTKILSSFSSIQSNNTVRFKTFSSFSDVKIELFLRLEIPSWILCNVFMKCIKQKYYDDNLRSWSLQLY